jgi:hypothetical protein
MKVKLLKKLRKQAKENVKIQQIKYNGCRQYIIKWSKNMYLYDHETNHFDYWCTDIVENLIMLIDKNCITVYKNLCDAVSKMEECRRYYIKQSAIKLANKKTYMSILDL